MCACHCFSLWANVGSTQATTQTAQQPCRCVIDVADIDQMNILQAALKAMEGAVAALPGTSPDYLLVDGNQLPKAFSKDCSQTVVRGDSRSTVIAAASILAKASVDTFFYISSCSTNLRRGSGLVVAADSQLLHQAAVTCKCCHGGLMMLSSLEARFCSSYSSMWHSVHHGHWTCNIHVLAYVSKYLDLR